MTSHEIISARIRQVRRRWRSQVLIRGISIFLASAIALLILGIWGAELFGFKPVAVWCLRILTGGMVLFTAWYFLYRPLRVRVSDVVVAQYIEEKYPQLEDRLVTAAEYGSRNTPNAGMINLVILDALKQTSRVDFSVFLNRKRLAAFGILGLAASCALLALLVWGPSFFPYGFSNLYAPWMDASGYSPIMIMVAPGDAEIAQGSDQLIDAQLVGFDSPDVRLFRRSGKSDRWSSSIMEPDPRGSAFRYLLVDVRASQQYYVESKGVRTPVYSLKVVERARVDRMDLTYNFPAYTGMSPQAVEDEGDIFALKGTKMDLRVRFNIPVEDARLVFDDGSKLDLRATGAQEYSGSFILKRSGFYTVQVTEFRGDRHPASREYDIDVVEDEAPRVTLRRPMRDVRATSVEEVFAEVRAEDDIAVGNVMLRYSVNGSEEKSVGLYGGNPPDSSITAAHTFFLEDFGLQPGDLISYYAEASDGNDATGPAISSSDIYFIQIRPFQQDYRQSQQQEMPGSQSGGEGNEGQQQLSRQQKEIISATFNLIREKERMDPREYEDGLESLAVIQNRLQDQAQGLADRLRRRETAQAGRNYEMLEEYLKNAVSEMEKAVADLEAQKPDSALPQEQKSLQQLMRAESLFREIQVSFSAQNSGSGSYRQSSAEDLAGLFELELNKLKNQYETVQRAERQEQDQKIDEALERLKKLAQRQQQLNENNRMRMQQGGSSSSSGSTDRQRQQQLLEQAEQLRRQLQRLSRERSSPRLNEAGDRLRKAIDEMRRALNDSEGGSSPEQRAQAERALQQLNEAVRGLERNQESAIEEGLQQAVRESGNLVKQQERIQEALGRLAREIPQTDSLEEAMERSADLVSRKNTLKDGLENLEENVRDLSRQTRRDDRATSDRLADAADTIRDRRLADRIEDGNLMIQNGRFESQQRRENFIRDGLEEVQKQLADAQSGLGQSEEGRIEEAADRARQLSEGLESMQRRMGEIQRENGGGSNRQEGAQQQGQGSRQDAAGQRAQNDRGVPSGQWFNPQEPGGGPDPNAGMLESPDNAIDSPIEQDEYADGRVRQFYRELEERLQDAEDLRRAGNLNPTLMENLENVIDALERTREDADRGYSEQAALLNEAIENMREVEFDLARSLQRLRGIEGYFIAGDSEAPEEYRELVEEYYKSIAEGK
ncbi:MAG: hypothetical protein JXR49_21005 [Acidobacteria bacterium]|nr:hypothetical protein [Acidobacteriota bacterium]